MATFPNPFNYNSPIADVVGKIGRDLTAGRKSEADRIFEAERALKLKNEREGRAGVANAFANFGGPGFDRNAAMHDAVIGDYSPQDLSVLERYGATNTYGAMDKRAADAFVGAGGAYSSTGPGFATSEANANARAAAIVAENARQFNEKPYEYVGPDGQPVVGTNKTAVGARPIMSESDAKGFRYDQNFGKFGDLPPAERAAVTGNPPSTHNYVGPDGKNYLTADGVTDVQTGLPLPRGGYLATATGGASDVGLTKPVQTNLQNADIATKELGKMIDYTEKLIADPNNIGLTGIVKGSFQDATQLAGNLANGLGYTGVNDAVEAVRKKAAASGVSAGVFNSIFDPTIPKLSTAYGLLVYSAAAALAGQQGRGVSDKDVKYIQAVVGDPHSIFASTVSLQAKLTALREILGIKREVINDALRPGSAAPGAPVIIDGVKIERVQ